MSFHRMFNPLKGEITTGKEDHEPWSASNVDAVKAKRRDARKATQRIVNIAIGLVLAVLSFGCGAGCWILWLGKLVMR
jgi:hypothetical protein